MVFVSAVGVVGMNKPSRDGLRSITPAAMVQERYGKSSRVDTRHFRIEAALYSSNNSPAPTYISQDWQRYIHPEGKPYFYRRSHPAVVTEADVTRPYILDRLNAWVALLADWADEVKIPLSTSAELYLNFDELGDVCKYYFVDHVSRVTFWLESQDTESIGINAAFSHAHLKISLQMMYWQHIESYSMHNPCPPGAIDDLIVAFMHGRVDDLTSEVSTFPYRADESAAFLEILFKCKEYETDGHITTLVARLSHYIAENYWNTHYGEAHARLSSNQYILAHEDPKRPWLLDALSLLCFNLPEGYRSRLSDLFVDDVVYGKRWSAFNANIMQDWKSSMLWAFALLISNLLSLPIAHAPAMTQVSLLLSSASLLVGAALSQRHQDPALNDGTCEAPAAYLTHHRTACGYQPIAIAFSLPKALFTWALVLFTVQAIWTAFKDVHAVVAGVSLAAMALLAIAVWFTIYPLTMPSFKVPWLRVPRIHVPILSRLSRREKSMEDSAV